MAQRRPFYKGKNRYQQATLKPLIQSKKPEALKKARVSVRKKWGGCRPRRGPRFFLTDRPRVFLNQSVFLCLR